MDRDNLYNAMVNSRQITLTTNGKFVTGRIQWIQMEDGSGYSFNVGLSAARGEKVVYVRCERPRQVSLPSGSIVTMLSTDAEKIVAAGLGTFA